MGLNDDEKLVAVGFADSKAVTVAGISRSGKEKTVTVSGADLAETRPPPGAQGLPPPREVEAYRRDN